MRAGGQSFAGSAGFQPAVSQVCSLPAGGILARPSCSARSADWKSAKQQVGNLRYSGGGRNAFTLVEMLVVVAILGIVMAVGIPTLHRRLNPESIEQGVKDIMEACSHARAYAILQSVPVDLVFDADTAQISLQPAGGARTGPVAENPSIDLAEPVFEESSPRATSAVSGETLNFTARLSEKVGIEAMEVNFELQDDYAESRVRFYPNGTSDECKIVLVQVETGERRLITLEVTTALADVESDVKKFR